MRLKNTSQSWGTVSQSLHWLIALLIFLALVLGYVAHEMDNSPEKARLFILHKSIGITVLLLVVLRFAWKLFARQPSVATGIGLHNERLARLGHLGLYALMFALPMTGWIVNTAANVPFKWMNILPVPDLPGVQGSWRYLASVIHWYLSILLLLMVIGHGGMAVIHHIRHKSNVLVRMLPSIKPSLFGFGFCVVFAALIVAALQSIQPKALKPAALIAEPLLEQVSEQVAHSSVLVDDSGPKTEMQWVIQQDSTLAFVGAYDDVPFDGEFKQFSGAIYFDPEKPTLGYFDVTIDTGSVTTYTDDWDSSLPDEDWFFTVRYPQAIYKASRFKRAADGYVAQGVLSLKGMTKPVPLHFSWDGTGDQATLSGSATVKRTDFNIGIGEWAADDTIGFDVQINVNLTLKRQP